MYPKLLCKASIFFSPRFISISAPQNMEMHILSGQVGVDAAWLSAGGYHHYISVNTFQGAGGTLPPPGHASLYHFAIPYPQPAGTGQGRQARARSWYEADDGNDATDEATVNIKVLRRR
jgi:catechol-2,3-dioxygenase